MPGDAVAVNQLALDPGVQALARIGGGTFSFDRLPPAAFENLLVVSTGRSPERIERALETAGCERLQRVGVVPITGSDVPYDGPMWVAKRVAPGDLTGISIRFSEALQYVRPGTGWVVFDNVSTLYMYAESGRVYHLLSTLARATRDRNTHGVFVTVDGILTEENTARLRSIFDTERDLTR